MNENLKIFLQSKITEPIQSVMLLEGGEVNQVFLLSTASQKVVARIHGADELSRFEKEKWCMEQAAHVGVKGPLVLDVGSFEGHAYMIISYIEGTRADQPDVDTQKVWLATGQYAKKIHSIHTEGFGEKLSDITDGSLDSWRKYLAYNISSLNETDVLISRDIITPEQSGQLKTYFEELREADLQFGLSHGDMSLQNTIVDNEGDVNLIDWGSAESHVIPHYDLGVVLTDSLTEESDGFKALLEGYGLAITDYEGIRGQIKSLMLLVAIDKIRWAIDRASEQLELAVDHFNKMYEWKRSS
jgi:aminoglycoside phosphotransferase (APT) family kinase protein